MLSILTDYLLRYKTVCIPNIGTFEIVQQSPLLNFAEKICLPPAFSTEYKDQQQLSDHQINTIAATHKLTSEQLRNQLIEFGKQLRTHIAKQPFYWKGFGTLRCTSDTVIFVPAPIDINSLKPVTADKVMRGTADHSMVIGDKEMTFQQATDALQIPVTKKHYPLWIGWIVVALALIAILVILYLGNFEPSSAGQH